MAPLVAIGYPDGATAARAEQAIERLSADLIIHPDAVAGVVRDASGMFKVSTNHRLGALMGTCLVGGWAPKRPRPSPRRRTAGAVVGGPGSRLAVPPVRSAHSLGGKP